jgi:hypothetical protein
VSHPASNKVSQKVKEFLVFHPAVVKLKRFVYENQKTHQVDQLTKFRNSLTLLKIAIKLFTTKQ